MISLPPTLGPYALGEPIGAGGMGMVVAATHRYMGRRVALKVRARDARGEEERLTAERFRLGARLQAQLEHDNVVHIHEYFETAELQIVVMEYLQGGSIEHRLKSGPLPIAAAVEVACRAAAALAFAHRRGIIHRDIKPGNLLMARPGAPESVRVTDFGVAKDVGHNEELTMAGANVGTLWYMPPEQFNAEDPTPSVDVYSLGATLYEMLTAKVPLSEASHAGLFKRFLDKEPPPPIRDRNPAVPLLLAAIVESALALDPEERVPSAEVFATWVRASIVGSPVERALHQNETDRLERDVAEARGSIDRLPRPVRLALDASLDRMLARTGLALAPASQPGFILPRRPESAPRSEPVTAPSLTPLPPSPPPRALTPRAPASQAPAPPPAAGPAAPSDSSWDRRSITAVTPVRPIVVQDDEDERTMIMDLMDDEDEV